MEKLINVTTIQNELIVNYPKYDLTDEEFICICRLLTFDTINVKLNEFMKTFANQKPLISNMSIKKIVQIIEIESDVYISLRPLYELMIETRAHQTAICLSQKQVAKVSHILNRELKSSDIEQINMWMSRGHSFDEIESAIYKALVHEVDHLNYIEKILYNESPNQTSTKKPIARNWSYNQD